MPFFINLKTTQLTTAPKAMDKSLISVESERESKTMGAPPPTTIPPTLAPAK